MRIEFRTALRSADTAACVLKVHTDYEVNCWATACGALAVSQEGTQAFAKSDVEKLAGMVKVSNIK